MTTQQTVERAVRGEPARTLAMGLRTLFLACALGFALDGCAPTIEFLREAPEFDHASLSRGGVSVCGVTTIVGPYEPHERQLLTDALEKVLLKEREDLSVFPTDRLRQALGLHYGAILMDFEGSGELSRAALGALDSLIGEEVRYLVLARIESE